MRFIHTGDWHLGRMFHNLQLTDDQRYTLDGLVRLAVDRQVDAVVVAGDVFDRAVPPAPAVELLSEVVGRLAMDHGIPVIIIAGNHDGPARLEYMSQLVARAGAHIVGRVGGHPASVDIMGADGVAVQFWPLAYTDPETARYDMGSDDIHGHEAALAAQLAVIRPTMDEGKRQVLVGHAFVTGSTESDSERPLTVGGSGSVDSAIFEGFDYVALGHLHRPQRVGADHIRYAGSLLKYSFDESDHRKSVTIVELDELGQVDHEEVELPVRHGLTRLRGTLVELLAVEPDARQAEDYIEVILTDTDPVLDPIEKLRRLYSGILSLRREQTEALLFKGASRVQVKERTPSALFGDFYKELTGETLSKAQAEAVKDVCNELERTGQERQV